MNAAVAIVEDTNATVAIVDCCMIESNLLVDCCLGDGSGSGDGSGDGEDGGSGKRGRN